MYLRTKRDAELGALLERINPESLPSHSHSLRAAAYYVQGLQAFFGARYNEAKYEPPYQFPDSPIDQVTND